MINRARWRWSANTATRFAVPAALVLLTVTLVLYGLQIRLVGNAFTGGR